jgi:hypothetical protein
VLVLVVCHAAWASDGVSLHTINLFDCRADLYYDDAANKDGQIDNTIALLYGSRVGEYPFLGTPAENIQEASLIEACHAKEVEFSTRAFVSLPTIIAYTRAIKSSISDYCRFVDSLVRGQHDPSALRNYAPAQRCSAYVDALEGKSDLMMVWEKLVVDLAAHNGDPATVMRNMHAHDGAPDFEEWAHSQILKYGWNNCATKTLEVNAPELKASLEAAQTEFRETFRLTTKDCSGEAD